MSNDLVERLNQLAAHMNKIEGRLKKAEILREEVVIAGINELRYAGRRFIDAWSIYSKPAATQDEMKEFDNHLIIAKQYLENADHDITDAICYHVHGEMNYYIKRYGVSELNKVSADFLPFMKRMAEMNQIVTGSREKRAERRDAYQQIEHNYIPELLDRYDLIKFSDSLFLKGRRKSHLVSGIWGAVVAVTVIFGVITGAITLVGWDGIVHLPWIGQKAETQLPTATPQKTLPNPSNAPRLPTHP